MERIINENHSHYNIKFMANSSNFFLKSKILLSRSECGRGFGSAFHQQRRQRTEKFAVEGGALLRHISVRSI